MKSQFNPDDYSPSSEHERLRQQEARNINRGHAYEARCPKIALLRRDIINLRRSLAGEDS